FRAPPDLLAALERERRKGVPSLVHRPVAKTRAPERGLPHALADVGDVQRPTGVARADVGAPQLARGDRKSTRLNSSHVAISYAVFCLKKKKNRPTNT